jgi:hypothetical protein
MIEFLEEKNRFYMGFIHKIFTKKKRATENISVTLSFSSRGGRITS